MKSTFIIRRVDDLGRVVIPKEIRRKVGIMEGEPLEIYLVDNGVAFKKINNTLSADATSLLGQVQARFTGGSLDQMAVEEALNKAIEILKKNEVEW